MRSKRVRPPQFRFPENAIHVGVGFHPEERPRVVETLAALRSYLGKLDSQDVNVYVSLHERGVEGQHVMLRTCLHGLSPLSVVGKNSDIGHALAAAKHGLIRAVDRQVSARHP